MLKNYLKVAYRNIMREKGYTLIHIISLGLGIGCFLFLLLLSQYGTHFNTFNKNADRIYRVIDQVKSKSGNEVTNALTPMPWGPAMKSEFPEIDHYTRLFLAGKSVVHKNDVFNTAVIYTDPSIFKIFTYPFAEGDSGNALNGPNKAVLTHETAKMLFGDSDPLNKFIKIDNKNYEVTGVLKRITKQSNLNNNFSILVSTTNLNTTNDQVLHNWNEHSVETFILLKKGANPAQISQQMPIFLKHFINSRATEKYSPQLQPLLKMYLGPSYMNDPHATLKKSYIYIFLTLSFMILLISCINFINISTARASKRNREVGIRKVIGATGEQLVFQYLFEVFMVTVLAIFLACLLIEIMLPPFNALSGWNVHMDFLHNSFLWIYTFGIVAFVTLMAGGYPAFYLSRFRPARIFRPTSSRNRKSKLRAGLVITQFTLAAFMLLSALIVKKQVQFLYHKDLGYNRQGVMQIYYSGTIQQAKHFRNDIQRNTLVKDVSLVSNGPFSPGVIKTYRINRNKHNEDVLLHTFYSDSHFLPLLQLKIIKGRNFNTNIASDSTKAIIINEAAVKSFGWTNENAVGKIITKKNDIGKNIRLTVIGVIHNYNYETLDKTIKPMAFLNDPGHFSMIVIKVDPGHIQAATNFIRNTWKNTFPDHFFYSQFIQGQIKQMYDLESIISQMLTFITYLTIIIACLGLLGLAAYSTLQRAKEISVRKVLGSSVKDIVILLSKEFIQYVSFALLIGLPLAYYALNLWLNNYVYHASIGFIPVIVVILGTLIIAWLTIGWQTIKAALTNPAENLRNE
jgi:putative ABC transport system permease protein